MDITKLSIPIGVVVAIVTSLWSGYMYIESTYAKSDDVVLIEMRLEQKIQSDFIDQLQQRLWKIEDRYGVDLKNAPDVVKEEYRQLIEQKRKLEKQVDLYQEKIQNKVYK